MKIIYVSLLLFLCLFLQANIFAQSPCAGNQAKTIVVLGSSTAAGSGPSNINNAWVNRYRSYVQTVNSQHQVINLGVGGTTTYNIMPDWFATPQFRPSIDSSKNISYAIAQGADAIIVNMPSNDAARGYDAAEQMGNFRLLKSVADSANIPIWICTTQPRNFSAAQKTIQLNARDSVLAVFGTYALDFWSGFADVNNDIKQIYDSGDGVHMNDTAHEVLFNIVKAKGILDQIADTLQYADHMVSTVQPLEPYWCGDSASVFQAEVANIGILSASNLSGYFVIENLDLQRIDTFPMALASPLTPCSTYTLSLNLNTYQGANYRMKAYLASSDSIVSNDTSAYSYFTSLGTPSLSVMNDTLCLGNLATLSSVTDADHLVWYDSLQGGNVLAVSDSLQFNLSDSVESRYVEAVRGPLHFSESLFTTSFSNVNYNGIMFDIIAADSLIIDSLSLKVNSTGQEAVVAYYKNGSHIGFENNSLAWTNWGIDTVQVQNSGDFIALDYSDLTLLPNDTLGVYLHMQNSSSDLSYYRSSSPTSVGNNKLTIPSGSGIDHTFGSVYYPRNFSGEVFYHYGFNPKGSCSSDRKTVSAFASKETIDLGQDTVLALGDSLVLSIDTNFSFIVWSTPGNSRQLTLDTSNFSVGINTIHLSAVDQYGCAVSDTIVVTFSNTVGLEEMTKKNISIFPNPTKGELSINGLVEKARVKLFSVNGQLIRALELANSTVSLTNLNAGIYILQFENEVGNIIDRQKLLIQK